ncbi:MAG: response regulator [Phycisphaerae bacterium]|nr:response regulator [Phycisphaerae bacterium]
MNNNDHPIAIVDDDESALDLLQGSLAAVSEDITVYRSPVKCLGEIRLGKYDLLVTDIRMPEMDGLDLVKQAKIIDPGLAVLVVTGFADVSLAVKSLQYGAADFIEKPFTHTTILNSVNRIVGDQLEAGRHSLRKLTKSELVILFHIADGLSNSEIAHKLSRSVRTIEDHRSHLMRKLGVDNIVDLVKKAINIGLVSRKVRGD